MMLKKYTFIILQLSLLFFAQSGVASAAETAGTVERIAGNATLSRNGFSKTLQLNTEVYQGDQINTTDAELLLRLTDGTVLSVRPNTSFTVAEYRFNQRDSNQDNFLIKLAKGGFRTVTGLIGKRSPQKVHYHTPAATIGIRGTDFEVAVLDQNKPNADAGTYNKVFEGGTYLENNQGNRVEVAPNQAAFSPANTLQIAQQFGLLKQVPNVFFNGKFDNLLDAVQEEAMNRLEGEITKKIPGGQLPAGLKELMPKLGDFFK